MACGHTIHYGLPGAAGGCKSRRICWSQNLNKAPAKRRVSQHAIVSSLQDRLSTCGGPGFDAKKR